jgi:peptide/nickel transport system substrate-binding protein
LLEEAPMVFLHHQEYLLGVSENVKGLIQFPTNLTYLKDAYIEE